MRKPIDIIMVAIPIKTTSHERVIIAVMILLGIFCPTNLWAEAKSAPDQGKHSTPEISVRYPTPEEEFDVVWQALYNFLFYKKHGYSISLPDHELFRELEQSPARIRNSSKEDLYAVFSSSVYRISDYAKGLSAIKGAEDTISQALSRLEALNKAWGFKLFENYEVLLTLYGPGGQYDPQKGRVIIRTTRDGMFARVNPVHTIIHEIVHIGINDLVVNRFKLAHWEKERVVDLICTFEIGDLLKDYVIQTKRPTSIDKFITKESISNLPLALEKYQEGNKTQIKVIAVDQVFPNSEAHRIGLQKGDVILQYEGIRIWESDDLVQAVKANVHKERIELSILRDSEVKRFIVKGGRLGVKISEQIIQKEGLPDEFN